MSKGIILSGMRPTGALHLGNYYGALENWVKLQNEYDCYFFVADWHALTTDYEDTSVIKSNIESLVLDYLSAGLDPDKCSIFLQSAIPEHAELHLIFSMVTPLSWLERCPTYKDQLNQMSDRNITTYGFLGYPCLMSADVLMYKADYVPVGEDQLPHLELTREIARRFNHLYGKVFPEPKPLLTKSKYVVGTDGRKMSKSYNNTILLSSSPEEIHAAVFKMTTDPGKIRKNDPGNPDICSVFTAHKIFNPDIIKEIETDCRKGDIGCVQCKRKLSEKMAEELKPIYERRQKLLEKPEYIREVIEEGNKKARKIAQSTIHEVREAMKIDW